MRDYQIVISNLVAYLGNSTEISALKLTQNISKNKYLYNIYYNKNILFSQMN